MMKSNFSRILHYPLSYSGLTRISRWKKFATWFDLDYRVKPDNDGFCTGRSMVEMLGVLAIIGVLSVGAIAGYNKAMTKYKLNKQAVTSILFIVISYIIFQSLSNSVYIFDRKFPMAE